ncbi:Uncharacterized protein APZ42_006580 [Daphnia magna]|uniref:Uncharacterized protein n=1 Tax=Daphnia magna TaxID=35525 RepID=A0A0P5A1T1_9CRUS|nr:Uncharacterized protein APZ42_006580 [Daphnia magna]
MLCLQPLTTTISAIISSFLLNLLCERILCSEFVELKMQRILALKESHQRCKICGLEYLMYRFF